MNLGFKSVVIKLRISTQRFLFSKLVIRHQRLLCSSVVDRVDLTLEKGLPTFSIPLPSRREICIFRLRPHSQRISDLINFIKDEDKGVDRVCVYNKEGKRIAQSNTIMTLITQEFDLQVNDKSYSVPALSLENSLHETVEKLSDVRSLVSALHSALNVEDYHLEMEKKLKEKAESIKEQLAPFEVKRNELAQKAAVRTRHLTWAGLAALGVQFGVLARLTWWEYSWDIMEPVTYFVGTGTSMALFAYYVITKQDYVFPDVFNREYLKKFHKEADKSSFDIAKYNKLKESLAEIELDIKRLRDPLLLNLPLQQSGLIKKDD